ncbi:low molecular weight protein-tyrosine-phosphatase [Erythrobacter sp. F6033]|uniref:low molecular weight protein-tyrosine-phosphatase n=1 Tax=Erythrobacter sp. F6033 TaxID=2926401 RepID=UPI001FF28D83|nr:low molecular weight protein-tyrosine-phosphatase [Erythrobacter sp. F6033]MCK0128565.1 low molecular weight phosphotyrosine protein phosphatase [Erythrobacter sp. F6033]
MSHTASVLFVCLGNICRSPLAEAAFRAAADDAGLAVHVDSVGTAGYHVGEPPDPRSIRTAAARGIDITSYRGRQLSENDFHEFTHIFAMDQENLRNIKARAPDGAMAEISLLLDLVAGQEGEEVGDPYYGGDDGFDRTWAEVSEAADALAAKLRG